MSEHIEMRPWIGVDLDGTLAHYEHWQGTDVIGTPIEPMVKRVKDWLAEGTIVKIFTARACHPDPEVIEHVQRWTEQVFGVRLEVTCKKDFGMIQLWDDRCVQVIPNTGMAILDRVAELENEVAGLQLVIERMKNGKN